MFSILFRPNCFQLLLNGLEQVSLYFCTEEDVEYQVLRGICFTLSQAKAGVSVASADLDWSTTSTLHWAAKSSVSFLLDQNELLAGANEANPKNQPVPGSTDGSEASDRRKQSMGPVEASRAATVG